MCRTVCVCVGVLYYCVSCVSVLYYCVSCVVCAVLLCELVCLGSYNQRREQLLNSYSGHSSSKNIRSTSRPEQQPDDAEDTEENSSREDKYRQLSR